MEIALAILAVIFGPRLLAALGGGGGGGGGGDTKQPITDDPKVAGVPADGNTVDENFGNKATSGPIGHNPALPDDPSYSHDGAAIVGHPNGQAYEFARRFFALWITRAEYDALKLTGDGLSKPFYDRTLKRAMGAVGDEAAKATALTGVNKLRVVMKAYRELFPSPIPYPLRRDAADKWWIATNDFPKFPEEFSPTFGELEPTYYQNPMGKSVISIDGVQVPTGTGVTVLRRAATGQRWAWNGSKLFELPAVGAIKVGSIFAGKF